MAPLDVDVLTARALAPLEMLAQYAERHLVEGGRLLALKGARVQAEIEAMRRRWQAEVTTYAGEGDCVLVEVSGIERRGTDGP